MLNGQPIFRKQVDGNSKQLFSILIPTWNNLSYLQLCVESIRKNSRFPHQIIIHVNEGQDGTLDWIEAQKDIAYTHSRGNIGICYAVNIARSLATTDYIVYMNDDMYVCPDWDQVLHNEIKEIGHPYFFLSATAIEPYDSGNDCVIVKDYGTGIENFREEDLLKDYSALPKADWQGSTWPPNIVHKDVWDFVGGYSTEFSPGMYSDPDFSMKLWLAGVRIFKGVAASRIYHFGSKSTLRITKNKGYYTFVAKWGQTPGTFTKKFLRTGSLYQGATPEPQITRKLLYKNLIKRLVTAFRKR
jgi:GT2 family glycosyltransferase